MTSQTPTPLIPRDAASAEALDHCWRRIGVQGGDQSCERLLTALHCRNCPVYADAARQLLGRPAEVETNTDWQRDLRRSGRTRTALVFRVGTQWLGLPPDVVAEVAANPPLRRLAHRTDGHIEGVVNVRGELRLCVSLSELLGLGRRSLADARSRLVLVDAEGGLLAFRCDEMRGLTTYHQDDVQPVPDTLPQPLDGCVEALLPTEAGHVALLNAVAVTRLISKVTFE